MINDVEEDIPSTVAFTSDDCDRDYRDVIAKVLPASMRRRICRGVSEQLWYWGRANSHSRSNNHSGSRHSVAHMCYRLKA